MALARYNFIEVYFFMLSSSTSNIAEFKFSFFILSILSIMPPFHRYAVQWNPAFDNTVMMLTRLCSRVQTSVVLRHTDGLNVLANRQTGMSLLVMDTQTLSVYCLSGMSSR